MQIPPFTLDRQFQEIGSEIESEVSKVLKGGQYIGGQEIAKFEESFSNLIGVENTIGCNSGTDALVLALRALDIGVGDEVITSSFSFFATAEAISAVGANPVLVDIDPETYLINTELIEQEINSNTKAIMPVHLFGNAVNMTLIKSLAKKYDLKVIEDCAQATCTMWENSKVGSIGDIGCFSFFPTKNLRLQAQTKGWSFPYLYDENQNFAKKLKAACTPDFYLFSNEGDGDFLLYYHGQLDDSRPGNNIPLSGKDLRSAVKDLNQDNSYPSNQMPSLGCNIKWTPGKEPSWFK